MPRRLQLMFYSPFDQFELNVLTKILPLTNYTVYLIISVASALFILSISVQRNLLIPTPFQLFYEGVYVFILSLVTEQVGKSKTGLKYFPVLFTLFQFILVSNLLGLLPYSFTVTSHIALTLLLSLSFFSAWIIEGFRNLGLKFLRIFLPSNIPMWLLPLLVVIEILSFLIRPLSLSIRLFANMLAGHILLFILGTATLGLGLAGFLPFVFICAFLILELGIAFLQAYVFTILLCIYLADSTKAH